MWEKFKQLNPKVKWGIADSGSSYRSRCRNLGCHPRHKRLPCRMRDNKESGDSSDRSGGGCNCGDCVQWGCDCADSGSHDNCLCNRCGDGDFVNNYYGA